MLKTSGVANQRILLEIEGQKKMEKGNDSSLFWETRVHVEGVWCLCTYFKIFRQALLSFFIRAALLVSR